jgi:quercetin dioxygenase-like cupin family protein
MTALQFIRPFGPPEDFGTSYPGYHAQVLSHLESAMMLAVTTDAGGCGPNLHYHLSDQIYYLLGGAANVRLGDDLHTAHPGTLVFIPAGLPHCSWNDGPETETHFEIIVPSPVPGDQIVYPVESVPDVPPQDRTDRRGYLRSPRDTVLSEPLEGFRMAPLATAADDSSHIMVSYVEADAGKGDPDTHIHSVDQYYLALKGELTVEIALQRHIVHPDTLIVIPAGVPHRLHNSGASAERHLAILSPLPMDGQPWDVCVTFEPTGVTYDAPDLISQRADVG